MDSKQLIAVPLFAVALGSVIAACDRRDGGGHMDHMMGGGMMGRMSTGGGDRPLPEAQSPAAQLFRQVCSQCHALPDPAAHTAQEWPAVVARMKQHMVARDRAVPDPEQLQGINDYLQQHAG